MNSLRKSLGLLVMSVMLAAFALPASATNKSISLTVPGALPAGPNPVTVSVAIKNTGNSTANSFEIDWKSPAITVLSATANGTTITPVPAGAFPAGLTAGYRGVVFTNQPPLKPNKSVTITLTLQVDGCAAGTIDWFAYAWTGSPSTPSQSFSLPAGTYQTASSPVCTITFTPQPADTFIDTKITGSPFDPLGDSITAKLLQNGGPPPTGTSVSVSGTAGCATADPETTNAAGVAILTSLKAVAANPACQLTVAGYSGTSGPFEVVASNGTLDCGDTPEAVIDPETGASATVTRLDNAGGGACSPIPYALLWRDDADLLFLKPDVLQHVTATFEVTWPNEAAPEDADVASPAYGRGGAIELSQQEFPGSGPLPIDLCQGTPTYVEEPAGSGNFVLESMTGVIDLVPGGTVQHGCFYDRDVRYGPDNDPGVIRITEFIYLEGDWKALRP